MYCCRAESHDVATNSLPQPPCMCLTATAGSGPAHACSQPLRLPCVCNICNAPVVACLAACLLLLSCQEAPEAPANNMGDCRVNLSHLDSIILSACALQGHRPQHPDQVVAGELGQGAVAQLECLLHDATVLQPVSMHSGRETLHDSSSASGLQRSQQEKRVCMAPFADEHNTTAVNTGYLAVSCIQSIIDGPHTPLKGSV